MNGYELIGRNVICEMLVDDTYFPLFCAKEVGLTKTREKVETTHINSGLVREFVPGPAEAQITSVGVTHINSGNGRLPITYLLTESVMAAMQTFRLTLTDNRPTPNVVTMTFAGFFSDLSFTGPRGGLSNSTAGIQISGDIVYGSSVPSPAEPACEVQDPLYIDAIEGADSVHHTDLEPELNVEKIVLEAARSGVTYTETTGTPSGTQFKFNDDDGTIDFDPLIPFNAGEVVYVLYKQIQSAP